jgi:hypothetical protein
MELGEPETRAVPAPTTARMARSRTGRRLVRIGLTGAALGIALTVLGLIMVDGALGSVADSMVVTDDAIEVVGETIEISNDVVAAVAAGTDEVRGAVADTSRALTSTAEVLAEADAIIGESVPGGIDAIRGPLPGLIAGARQVTDALTAVPFVGAAFDPGIAEGLADVDEELGALAAQLRDPSVRLGDVAEDFTAVRDRLSRIDEELGVVMDGLARAEDLLGAYDQTATDAAGIVEVSLSDLDRHRWIARAVVVMLGGAVVLGMAGLVIVGRQMESDSFIGLLTAPPEDEGRRAV